MLNNYLNVLEESLEKKLAILEQIDGLSDAQAALFKEETLDLEHFDEIVDEKDEFIDQLEGLDSGFETLYDKVREELQANQSNYAQQVRRMQELIARITDISVSIQAKESRNKVAVEKYFAKEKKEIAKSRKSVKAAYGYYQNMSNAGVSAARFLDQKK